MIIILRKMNLNIVGIVLVSALFFFPNVFADSHKVMELHGDVFLINESLTIQNKIPQKKLSSIKLSKNAKLKDKALIQVGSEEDKEASPESNSPKLQKLKTKPPSFLKMTLKKGTTITLTESWLDLKDSSNSKSEPQRSPTFLELPTIHWRDGVIEQIILQKGQIKYDCESDCNLKVVTGLFESTLPVGEFIVKYDPSIPQVQILVISGETVFRGLENEISVTLRAGQFASFEGKFTEDGQIGYDVLLQGRKVAQGQLSDVGKIENQNLKSVLKIWDPPISRKTKSQMIAANSSEKEPMAKKPGEICTKPNGKLNDCLWTCIDNPRRSKICDYSKGAKCQRQRCNANGEWADLNILPLKDSRCESKAFVAACDY